MEIKEKIFEAIEKSIVSYLEKELNLDGVTVGIWDQPDDYGRYPCFIDAWGVYDGEDAQVVGWIDVSPELTPSCYVPFMAADERKEVI